MTDTKKIPTSWNFLVCAAGGATGWLPVHPFDIAKVRLQLLGATGVTKMPGTFTILSQVAKTEGPTALYSGLSAGIVRQLAYGTIRLGLYDVFKTKLVNENDSTTTVALKQAGSGIASGALAAFINCPVDLSLVRMQADGRLPLDQRRGYTNVFNALRKIAMEEGVLTYWRGATPTVTRAMVVSSTQLGTYDQAKTFYSTYVTGVPLHFAASLTSAMVYCVTSLPLDTAKTRMQEQKPLADGTLRYKGTLSTLVNICKTEGVASCWRGFPAYFLRGGGHTIFMFLALEQYRNLYWASV